MNQLMQLADQPWQKVFLIALVASAVYYFTLFDNGASQDALLVSTSTEVDTTEKTLKETQVKMKDLEKFRAELSDQEAQVTEVMQFLPKDIDLIGLIRLVQDSAKQAGMTVRETKTDAKTTRKDFFEMQRVTLTMQGTYTEATKFLSLLSKLPRLVTVDSLRMVASKDRLKGSVPSLNFETTVVGYRFVAEEVPPEGATDAPAQ